MSLALLRHPSPAALPRVGLLGAWYVSQLRSSPRRVIPNAVETVAISPSLFGPGRRQFLNPAFWTPSAAVTVVDAAATAPDGSSDASTVVVAAGNNWQISAAPAVVTLPAGTYTLGLNVRYRGTGGTDFKLGVDSPAQLTTFTATSSWQRFAKTITSTGAGMQLEMISGDGTSAANLEICDFELFAGAADLGPVPIGSHLYLGSYNAAALPTVSGGALDMSGGGVANIAFATAQTLTAGTVIYTASRVGTGADATFQPVLAKGGPAGAWNQFAVGGRLNDMPNIYLGGTRDNNIQQTGALIDPNSAGWYVYGHTWNASRFTRWVNDVKLLDRATTNLSATFANLDVGFLQKTFYAGYQINAIAMWSRVLSDAEMRQAYAVLARRAQASSIALQTQRTVVFAGDSITSGSSGSPGFVFAFGPNASPVVRGAEQGSGGTSVPTDSVAAVIDAVIPPNKNGRTFILHVFFGANDLRTGSQNKTAVQFLTDLQNYLAARRAAGWDKLVVGTVMSSTTDGDGGAAMDAKRAIANPAIVAMVGTYCDAVSDFAANANLGANGAANNATYFADTLHPTTAGHALMETIMRPVINAL